MMKFENTDKAAGDEDKANEDKQEVIHIDLDDDKTRQNIIKIV